MKKNIKHFKKWLALLLAVVLVGGICVVTRGGSLRATEGDAPLTEEAASDTPKEEAPTEIVVSEEVKAEDSSGGTTVPSEDGTENIVPEVENEEKTEDAVETEKVETLPEPEEKIEEKSEVEAEEVKKEEVEKSVKVTSSLGGATVVEEGTPLTLTAHLTGYDDVEYELQWQQSEDGSNWDDIEGENDLDYTVILTEDNAGYLWRVSVSDSES